MYNMKRLPNENENKSNKKHTRAQQHIKEK